jgi:hypothetical protein
MGIILSLDERRWPMEAVAIPLPRPDKTPPVTMMYLVGLIMAAPSLTASQKAQLSRFWRDYASSFVIEAYFK